MFSLLLLAAIWQPIYHDPCDVVVEIDHWCVFGGNEVHRINGWFLDYSVRSGTWNTNVRTIEVHPMIDKETREGVRVSAKCRIQGKWTDEKRTMILPHRVTVFQRRVDE